MQLIIGPFGSAICDFRRLSTIQSAQPLPSKSPQFLSLHCCCCIFPHAQNSLRLYIIEPHLTLRRAPTYYVYERTTVCQRPHVFTKPTFVVRPADATYRAHRLMVIPGMTIVVDNIWVMKEVP